MENCPFNNTVLCYLLTFLIFIILLGNHRFVFLAGTIMLLCQTTASQRKRKKDREEKE